MEKYIRNNNIFSGKLDEDLVLMNIESGEYLSFNISASKIWELLENTISIEDICKNLLEEYDVDKENCDKEVRFLLKQLMQKSLIHIVS